MKINSINNNLSFGSTNRRYIAKDGEEYGCNSWLFRGDMDWDRLAKYQISHFKDKEKVNTIMFAASDGSEAYTDIISLHESPQKNKGIKKFFPIQAYDIDEEILKAANSGYINTNLNDRVMIQMNTFDYNKYFDFSKTDKKLNIPNDYRVPCDARTLEATKAKEILTKNVKFNFGDMFKKILEINDNSNTMLFCRNILGYFEDNKIEEFIKLAQQKLKTESLFAIGNHDSVLFNIKECMEEHGFKEVFKNLFKRV